MRETTQEEVYSIDTDPNMSEFYQEIRRDYFVKNRWLYNLGFAAWAVATIS